MSTQQVALGIQQRIDISAKVNGQTVETTVPANLLLSDFLRDTLCLTGTKVGCETGQCGACTVLLDGVSVKSCTVLAAQLDGSEVVTIEGVAPTGSMSKVQTALWEQHAVQCGYCTPGLVLSLTDLISRNASPTDAEIRRWMDGNICRCGVYQNAVRAVRSIADAKDSAGS